MTSPKKKLAANSAATFEVDDVLIEIFLLVPLYIIQRFKSVCKNWKSLINNPTFCKLWRKRNLKPSTGVFLYSRKPVSTCLLLPFSPNNLLPFQFLRPKFKIKQSCNGLLLCSSSKTKYHVYNPTNDTCHTLPELGKNIVFPGTKNRTMSLAFDPNKFGPCYKVICCVLSDYDKTLLHVHVYSSDTGVWKSIFNHRVIRHVNIDNREVYWNGSIHWMYDLTYFDVENEMFKRIPRPPDVSGWRNDSYFGESWDRLSCAKLWKATKGNLQIVNVYELKRDYSEWVLKYPVYLDNLPSVTSVLSVVHGVEEDDSFLVLKTKGGIVRYNLVSKISEELPVLLTGGGIIVRAFQYIEYSQYLV